MQCAAIPYRKANHGGFDILLVTSRGKGNWILPKGKVKLGKTPAVSAQEEVYEEAGARGTIDQALVARVDLPAPEKNLAGPSDHMQIFAMEVVDLVMIWPEMFQRQRRWVHLEEAIRMVKPPHFRAALKTFATIVAPIT
ncbi:NUDIX hydrolase [Novosphingobium terrae]|uniref:NUDIX hydrolase n=1 Tax=Novosphingobium terrae TaxID=2726189 RepID=UPI00197F63C5|nr:NUDIX hydrolase [Novosphingobium terrae]